VVSELDEAWASGLAEAELRARAHGRAEIAEYLALRRSNDFVRKIAIDWLLSIFTAFAAEANRKGGSIQVATEQLHRFKVGNATMVGPRLDLRSGVRKLFIEVGWPRTPRDGVIRGGGLACGNIQHLGLKRANESLRLIMNDRGSPSWIVTAPDTLSNAREIHERDIRKHLSVLLDEPHP
jgi:hypothetical protein